MTERDPRPPEPLSPREWERLARYLAGESSTGELEEVHRWLSADPVRRHALSELERRLAQLRATPPADLDVEGSLRRVHARMDAPVLRILPGGSTSRARLPLAGGWRLALRAAALVLLVAGGVVIARGLLRRAQQSGAPAVALARSYRSAVGQIDSLRLADGTRVILAPGSMLTVPANFPAGRVVALAGEALFEVRHDAAHPFTVRTGGAVVQDVGTIFDVRGDAGDVVRVVVKRGEVRLSSARAAADRAGGSVLLRANQAGVLEADGRVRAEAAPRPADALAWARGRLVFRGAPLGEVAAALRRWYGVELRITDPALARRHLTTSFEGESRERVLRVIALALGGRVEMHGDTAVLDP